MMSLEQKYRAVGVFLAAGLLAIAGRLVHIQVVKHEVLSAIAERRQTTVHRLDPLRGDIVDRNGETLAISVPAWSLYAHPRRMSDAHKRALCQILVKYDLEDRCKRLERDRPFVWLARNLPADLTEGLPEALAPFSQVAGVQPGYLRRYPKQALAGQLLGFVGVDGHGLEGIERAFDDVLSPEVREVRVERDARRRFLLGPEELATLSYRRQNVQLTIDAGLQAVVEGALDDAVAQWGGRAAVAVFADARTGAIRAAAIAPRFDPNHFSEYTPADWRMRFATDTFEPGSTVKPLVLSAALAAGMRLNDIVYAEQGRYLVDEHVITDDEPWGWLSLRNVVVRSSNIGVAKVAEKLGADPLYRAYRAYGLGQRLSIGLPGEARGILRPVSRWSRLDFAAASFGQGLSVTPLQLLAAYLAIANDGRRVMPQLVERVWDAETGVQIRGFEQQSRGYVFDLPDDERERLFTRLRGVLRSVVVEGTGSRAEVAGLEIGGKTGTAQKPDLDRGGYKADAYVAWFVGMFPVSSPRWVGVVLVDEPEQSIYGGAVAAPVFARVAGALAVQDGTAFVAQASPGDPGARLPSARRRSLPVARHGTLPDFRGLSLKQAGALASELNLQIQPHGSGVVVEQKPESGTAVSGPTAVELRLEVPA